MSKLNGNANLTITCPKCHQQFEEIIARVEISPTLTCPGCRASVKVNAADFRKEIDEAKAIYDLKS